MKAPAKQPSTQQARWIARRRQFMAVLSATTFVTGQLLFGEQVASQLDSKPHKSASSLTATTPQAIENPFVEGQRATQEESATESEAAVTANQKIGGGKPNAQPSGATESASSRRMAKERGVEVPVVSPGEAAKFVKAKPLPASQPEAPKKMTPPAAAKDEHLAPIVSASSMPRRMKPATTRSAQPMATETTLAPIVSPMRIELQRAAQNAGAPRPLASSAAQNSAAKPAAAKPAAESTAKVVKPNPLPAANTPLPLPASASAQTATSSRRQAGGEKKNVANKSLPAAVAAAGTSAEPKTSATASPLAKSIPATSAPSAMPAAQTTKPVVAEGASRVAAATTTTSKGSSPASPVAAVPSNSPGSAASREQPAAEEIGANVMRPVANPLTAKPVEKTAPVDSAPATAAPQATHVPTGSAAADTAATTKATLVPVNPLAVVDDPAPSGGFASRLAHGPQPGSRHASTTPAAPGSTATATRNTMAAMPETSPAVLASPRNRSASSLAPKATGTGVAGAMAGAVKPLKQMPAANERRVAMPGGGKFAREAFEPVTTPGKTGAAVRRAEFETPLAAAGRSPGGQVAAPANSGNATRQATWGASDPAARMSSAAPAAAMARSAAQLAAATTPTSPAPAWSMDGAAASGGPLANSPAETTLSATSSSRRATSAYSPASPASIHASQPQLAFPGDPMQPVQTASASTPPGPEPAGNTAAAAPFETVRESATVKLQAGLPVLLRTKHDVYRTAVVDENVCSIERITMREISVVGHIAGRTHVTFFMDDPLTPQVTYLVDVHPEIAK